MPHSPVWQQWFHREWVESSHSVRCVVLRSALPASPTHLEFPSWMISSPYFSWPEPCRHEAGQQTLRTIAYGTPFPHPPGLSPAALLWFTLNEQFLMNNSNEVCLVPF